MNTFKNNEIIYANLKVRHNGKTIVLKKIVYKQNNERTFYRKRILDKLGIYEQVKVIDVEIISRLGFEHKSNNYTKAKKNEEFRNKITGSYD
jgi:hypothetical protein